MKFILLVVFTLLCSMAAFAQGTDAGKEYETLVARSKAGDASVDYKALRMAYTRTKAYGPYGGDSEDDKAAFAAIGKKDYKSAAKSADKALEDMWVDMDAHIAAALAYGGLGDTAKAGFHKAVYQGLMSSILSSGDGKTPETAYVVISTHEEYVVLRALGLSAGGQSLNHIKEHSFDILKAIDPKTKAERSIYFNIDIVWKAETDMFSH